VKFKVDENLPIEVAEQFLAAHHDVTTVHTEELVGEDDPRLVDVCRQEGRVFVTLDLDFADIRTYPPRELPGMIVLRLRRQDKQYVLRVIEHIMPLIVREPLEHRLWIVEEGRIRVHGATED